MGIKYMVIENFHDKHIENYTVDHRFVPSYDLTLTNEHVQSGKYSLKLAYDLGEWKTGNGAMYIHFQGQKPTHKRPKKFGLSVYSEGKVPWMRATFKDGHDQTRIVNMTEASMCWHGWKYVDTPIGKDWPLPIQLESIYVVEVDKKYREDATYAGTIYFADLLFDYVDDIDKKGPYFLDTLAEKQLIFQSHYTTSIQVLDEKSGVDPSSIHVYLNGQDIHHQYEAETGYITVHLDGLYDGLYELEIEAKDKAGNIAIPSFTKRIEVDLSVDVDPPKIDCLTPMPDEMVYTQYPRITCRLTDEKSGISKEDIEICIGDEILSIYYDEASGWCYGLPKQALHKGIHTYKVHCQDEHGNKMQPMERSFVVDCVEAVSQAHEMIVIPDTHDAVYLEQALLSSKKENAGMILHMGDIVDGATVEEFERASQVIQHQRDKVLLHLPGNHEAFFNDLHLYRHYFGSATYHVEYGNVLVIVLNSAFDQSITHSDCTQFHYVQSLLDMFPNNEVVLATHVPIRDTLGTAHEMVEADAERLHGILANDRKQRPNRTISVLFGHLHVIQQWENDGVSYFITGNHAQKGYVNEEKGNLFGYGLFQFQENHVEYTYKPYFRALRIKNEQEEIQELALRKQEEVYLRSYGMVDVLATKYEVDLSLYPMLDMEWSVSDTSVASIDESGRVTGKNAGRAIICFSINQLVKEICVLVE